MHSLRLKILTITLVFFAFLCAAFVLYLKVTTGNYKRLRLEGIEKTVAFETEKVNKIIAVIERGAISLSRDGLLFFKSQSDEIGETSVLEYLHSFPNAVGGGFWFEPYAYNKNTLRAGVYAFFDKTIGEVRLDEFDMSLYDYHSQNWYREIIDSIRRPYQVVWTKPYIDDTSFSLMTTAGSGIFDEKGRLIAMSNIDWEIDRVVEELSAIKPTENSFVLLYASGQDFIISNTYTKKDEGASLQTIPWDLNADSFIIDGVRFLSFSRSMDNGWILSVQIPENEIFADVERQNNRFSVMIGFLSLIMLLLAYILISKLINAPIHRLITEVSQLALGNLDIQVDASSKDELGLLGRTFNKITADLKGSIEAYTRERAEKERMAAELAIAAEIQTSMLPCIFPPFPERTEFDIYAFMLPAKEVGGDLYDFYLVGENILALVIADVSGKGVPAALFMTITKILIKDNVNSGKSPGEVFETVNKTLCNNNDTGMFVTAFMGYYNITNGNFVYVNAGHNPPLIKKHGETFEFIKTKSDLVLGVMNNIVYKEEQVNFEPDDALYLYTDGVTESINPNRDLFSEQRLLTALNNNREKSPKELIFAIKQEIDNFTGGAEQADDITMLALKLDHYGSEAEPAMEELEAL